MRISERACNRRLKLLIDAGYIERKSVLYGVPRLYSLTNRTRSLIGAGRNKPNVRADKIIHDIAVLDTVVYFMKRDGLKLSDIVSDKEMQSKDGFNARKKHYPDFIFFSKGESYAVEVELSAKSKARLKNNIQNNFIEYDYQIWVVSKSDISIRKVIKDNMETYPNITEIIEIESVNEYAKLAD